MKVLGDNVLIEIEQAGIYTAYACATGVELTVETELIETSVIGAGQFATFTPSKMSFTGTLEGFTTLKSSDLSLQALRRLQITGARLKMKFSRQNADGSYITEAYFYITSTHERTSFPGLQSFTVEIAGTGQLLEDAPPIPATPYEYKYGSFWIDTTATPDTKGLILAMIQSAISNNEYNTGIAPNESANIEIDYAKDYTIRYLVYPNTIDDFDYWSERGNPFQQNVQITGGIGVFFKDEIPEGKIIANLYQTLISNEVIFSR